MAQLVWINDLERVSYRGASWMAMDFSGAVASMASTVGSIDDPIVIFCIDTIASRSWGEVFFS